MALVGQHSVRRFVGPVTRFDKTVDPNEVRGNDEVLRRAYVAHDADETIHVQSSNVNDRPVAGVEGRVWVTALPGSYRIWYDDGDRWHEIGNEKIDVEVIGKEAGGIAKGDVLKIIGWNNGLNVPEVQKVSSASDVAFAIAEEAIANNARGYVVNTGTVSSLDTSAFNAGDLLYPNTSGGLTTTKPTNGQYQMCAYVLRAATNDGVLFVEFSGPRIVETDADTASTVVRRDANGATALQGLTLTNLPTSATGLPAGTVWNDGGILSIV
jgi:hypothetical protein